MFRFGLVLAALWLFLGVAQAQAPGPNLGNRPICPGASQICQPIVAATIPPIAVTIPCDNVTCIAAWGMRLLKTGASLAIRITCADTTTHDIGFSGNDLNKSAADSACSGSSAPKITTYYDQTGGSQNCTNPYAQAIAYDNTDLLNGHSVGNTTAAYCQATLTSGITGGSTISVMYPSGSSGNNPTMWTGANTGSSYAGLRTSSNTTTMQAFEYNYSTFLDVSGAITLSAWQVNAMSWNGTTIHDKVNGSLLAADIAGQTLSSSTTFTVAWNSGGSSSDYFVGLFADVILLANSAANADTVATSECGYWNINGGTC